MNLTWSRYSQYVNICSTDSGQGFQEERWAFFRELISRGHRIRIITPMTIKSEKLLAGVKDGSITHEGGLDVRWMKKLIYNPKGFCKKDDDVLFVECGPPNFMFDDKYTGGLQIRRCAEISKTYKGLLIFSQNDPDLPMSIWKMACAKYPWSHKNNMYRIETKDNTCDAGKYNLKNYTGKEEYGWGDFDETFKDKRVVLMTKSLCPENVAEHYEGARSRYATLVKKGLLHVEGMPTAYEPLYINSLKLTFNENPYYDVVYTGYPRHREKFFMELFTGLPSKLKTAVSGPWNPRKARMLDENTECLGMIPGFINMPVLCNSSRSVLQLATKNAKKYDWVTSRHLEAVHSGALCLYDAEYQCMNGYLGEEFAVRTKDEAIKKYKWIRKMSADERYELWCGQMRTCEKYNWKWYVDRFEKMCARHISKLS